MAQVLAPHQQLAGYEILALVGKGGMGEVYRARQLSMDRIVALKVLHIRHAKQDPFTKSFIEEARAAGSLSHPNIIGVHDVGATTLPGSTEQVHYFSMEYIEGESLKEVLVREGRCPDDLIAVVMNGMAEALQYAEKMGIVHRDIKPDNIMITKTRLVKLADLGLAVRIGGDQVTDERSDGSSPKVMGTPMYMSPEQAKGQKIDQRTDQYSLGATLYHLLTGQPPYRGADARSIMRSHVYDPIPDPQTVRPDVPQPWRLLCMRLMAKQSDQRFITASDLRAAVHAAAHGISLQSFARRVVRPTRTMRHVSRTWQGVAVVAVLLVLVAGIAVVVHGGHSGPAAVDPQPGTQSQSPDASAPTVDPEHLRAVLASISADPKVALGALTALRNEPDWSSPLARNMLDQALASCRTALATASQQALEAAIKEPLAGIEQQLQAHHLQAAKEQLQALASQHAEAQSDPAFRDLANRIDAAINLMANAFRARLSAATSPDAIDAVMREIKQAPLSGDDMVQLDKLATDQRAQLAAAATIQATRKVTDAWTQLVMDLEAIRSSLSYGDLPKVVERDVQTFQSVQPEMVTPISDLGDHMFSLVAMGEHSLNAYFSNANRHHQEEWIPASISDQSQRIQIKAWGVKEVKYISEGTTEVHTAPRAQVTLLDYSTALDRAMPVARPTIDVHDYPLIKASCLWMWRSPLQLAMAKLIADQPLGVALCAVQKSLAGGIEINGRVSREDRKLHIAYDFSLRAPAMLSDFDGTGLSFGEHGLLWTTTTAVPKAVFGHDDGDEAALPRLAWKGLLRAPCQVRCVLWLHPAMLAMAGLEVGGRRLRLGYSHLRFSEKVKSQRSALVVTADDGSHYQAQRLEQNYSLWDPDQPLVLQWSMAEDGSVTAMINGKPVSASTVGVLPTNAPATFILQVYQFVQDQIPTTTSMELCSLSLDGTLAAP